MQQRYPSKGLLDFNRGIDALNTLLKVKLGFAQKLDNMEYQKGTPMRRKPFTEKTSADFTAQGVFQGAHEYIDGNDAARLLWGNNLGQIREFDTDANTGTLRHTFATTAKRIRMDTFMGALVGVNGADTPVRADATTYRNFGAPAAVTQNAPTTAAGSIAAGTYLYVVVACIRASGAVVVRSDHSNIKTVTTTIASNHTISWGASADSRVDYYEVYRTKVGVGEPYFLVNGTTGTSLVDSTTDASLSEQAADPSGRNGSAPKSKHVTVAGQRVVMGGLVDAADPDAGKSVHVSVLATNKYECEYFPTDGIHKFKLPGKGDLTCALGIGVKDEDSNRNDLFLAQQTSCYLLRSSDPYGDLETISGEVGCVGPVVQWGRFLFFVSLRGLEFLGPSGAPLLISKRVNPFLFGGGPLSLNASTSNDYLTMAVWDNYLFLTIQDDATKRWGNKALVMDLEAFDAYNPKADETARFTLWFGPGMAFFLALRDRSLVLFDNQNYRILKRGTGAYDKLAGVNTAISAALWSGGILGEYLDFRKTLAFVNCYHICDDDTTLRIEGDYDTIAENLNLDQVVTPRDWDKIWDKQWYATTNYQSCAPVSRVVCAAFFQLKLTVAIGSTDYIFIGIILRFRQVERETCGLR